MSQNVTQSQKLTARQQKVLKELLAGATAESAAEAAGVSRRTVQRWLRESEFKGALDRGLTEAYREAMGTLQQNASKAVETLLSVQKSRTAPASAKVQAARYHLSHVQQFCDNRELEERIEQLERQAEKER